MKIKKDDPILTAFALGELQGEEYREVLKQVESSEELQAAVKEIQGLSQAFSQAYIDEESLELDSSMQGKLLEKLESTRVSSPRKWLWPIFATVAAVFIAVIVVKEVDKISPEIKRQTRDVSLGEGESLTQPKNIGALSKAQSPRSQDKLNEDFTVAEERTRADGKTIGKKLVITGGRGAGNFGAKMNLPKDEAAKEAIIAKKRSSPPKAQKRDATDKLAVTAQRREPPVEQRQGAKGKSSIEMKAVVAKQRPQSPAKKERVALSDSMNISGSSGGVSASAPGASAEMPMTESDDSVESEQRVKKPAQPHSLQWQYNIKSQPKMDSIFLESMKLPLSNCKTHFSAISNLSTYNYEVSVSENGSVKKVQTFYNLYAGENHRLERALKCIEQQSYSFKFPAHPTAQTYKMTVEFYLPVSD